MLRDGQAVISLRFRCRVHCDSDDKLFKWKLLPLPRDLRHLVNTSLHGSIWKFLCILITEVFKNHWIVVVQNVDSLSLYIYYINSLLSSIKDGISFVEPTERHQNHLLKAIPVRCQTGSISLERYCINFPGNYQVFRGKTNKNQILSRICIALLTGISECLLIF